MMFIRDLEKGSRIWFIRRKVSQFNNIMDTKVKETSTKSSHNGDV